MTFGSLFSGIGGMDLGLERAGMECKWQVEIDLYATRVLEKHWPGVKRYGDIRAVTDAEPVDLIAGGFPCQDISYAGSGAGLDGKRSGLWFQFARIIREMEPRFVLVENVSALLNRGMADVLGTLSSLGFNAEWSTVSACSMGAPHTRDRVFIVAYSNEIRWRGIGFSDERAHGVCPGLQAWKASPRGNWGDVERWISEVMETGGGIAPASERGGMADGIPCRLHRIAGLGNAVVPQVAEWIGRRILESEATVWPMHRLR